MFCSQCGAKAPDDAAYCQKCGTKLTDGEPARQTPPPKKKSVLLPVVIGAAALAVVIILVAGMGKGGTQTQPSSSSEDAYEDEEASQTVALPESTAPTNADEARKLIDQWIRENDAVYDYTLEYDENIPPKAYEAYLFNWYIGGLPYATIYVSIHTGELSIYVDGSDGLVSMDDWYQYTWEPYLNGESLDDAPTVQLDASLYGRWRSADGTSLVLDEYGGAQTSMDLSPEWALGSATGHSWEASDGQLKLVTYYTGNLKYKYVPQDSYGPDQLHVGAMICSRVNGNTGDDMIGVWSFMGVPYFTFNADGTGAFAKDKAMSWSADEDTIYLNYSLYGLFDYYVAGDTLEFFFSDGSKTFLRVGN